MAELILKIGNSINPKGYQDGDIIEAFNQRRIRKCHAEMICHVQYSGFKPNGFRPNGIAKKFRELTYQYKFERISEKEIKRTNLTSDDTEVFSNVPNAKGEQIDAELFIKRRLRHPKHATFGATGAEVWFGGNKDFSSMSMDKVWGMIEADTQEREVNYLLWPLTEREKQVYLAIGVNDFSDMKLSEVLQPLEKQIGVDKNGDPIMELISKRKNYVSWQGLSLPETAARIQDKNIAIDIRNSPVFNPMSIVNGRSLP